MVTVLLLTGLYSLKDESASPTLLTESVQRGDIENFIAATGTFEPKQYVEVGAQVSGQLKPIYVEKATLLKQSNYWQKLTPRYLRPRYKTPRPVFGGQPGTITTIRS